MIVCSGERGQFSAESSSLGYFFQCRYALLEALQRLPSGERISISIETLDDVSFQTDGSPIEILQTKHHIRNPANLTDASPDLWKTLRIWIEGQASGSIPQDAQFFLITTAMCGDGTAAAYLRPHGRDEIKALGHLTATAATSTNRENAPAYSAFNSMSPEDRSLFMKAITVLDGSPSIGQLDSLLRQAVYYTVERRFLDSFLIRLEGWWYVRVVKHLLAERVSPILGEELEAETRRIQSQLRDDNLPIDDEIMRATVDASGYMGRSFVDQLRLIGVNDKRVVHAIKNYYRAFEQRSRWLREDLLYVGDLDRYEERLIEEWDLVFQEMSDALGQDAAEEVMKNAGRELYRKFESDPLPSIKPAVTEPAIARGTYQMLADDLRVGWHLKFIEHLRPILLRGKEASG
jgi:hypothetical protein